jgi:hypothetical protein
MKGEGCSGLPQARMKDEGDREDKEDKEDKEENSC